MAWAAPTATLNLTGVAQVSNGWARCTSVALGDAEGQLARSFQQGQTASFFYEFELLQDIEVPIGGVVLQNEKGVIVHGKSTLQYDSQVPMWVTRGSRIRFRQDITLDIAVGEYTFEVGLATMSHFDYQRREWYTPKDMRERTVRVCHLPSVARFAVVLRRDTLPIYPRHHGIADLPGSCQVTVDALTTDGIVERVS